MAVQYLIVVVLFLSASQVFASPRQIQDHVSKFDRVSITSLTSLSDNFPSSLRLRFESNNQNYTLALSVNEKLMAKGYKSMKMDSNGKMKSMKARPRCFYTGFVEEHRDASSVAVSLCHGVDGAVTVGADAFSLEPLAAGKKGSFADKIEAPHAFYSVEHEEEGEELGCGSEHAPKLLSKSEGGVRGMMRQMRKKKLSPEVSLQQDNARVMDILIFNDFLRIQRFGGDLDAVADDTAAIINALGALYDQGQFGERVQIRLAGQVFFETQNPFEPTGAVTADFSGSTLLNNFRAYRSSVLNSFPAHDAAHLFSTIPFVGGTIGVAFVGTMCRSTISNVGVNEVRFSTTLNSILVAHELGHNFGFNHDDALGCPTGSIMAPSLNSNANMFSTCSVDIMNAFLASGNSNCLPQEQVVPESTTTTMMGATTTTTAETTTTTTMATTNSRPTTPTTTSRATMPPVTFAPQAPTDGGASRLQPLLAIGVSLFALML